MGPLQSRILSRLVLDAISSLWVAHESLDGRWKSQTKQAITALQTADLTDTDHAAFFLLEVVHHLRQIESRLTALDRPFTAKKVRGVLDRVSHLTEASTGACSAWRGVSQTE
jgi:hypothetical protein